MVVKKKNKIKTVKKSNNTRKDKKVNKNYLEEKR